MVHRGESTCYHYASQEKSLQLYAPFLQKNCGAEHVILNLRAEILELDSWRREQDILYREVQNEIRCIEQLLKEYYALVDPFRPGGYTDEMMYELNAANEYTVMIARDIQSEIIAHGKPTAASVRHALNNPTTFYALQKMGLMPIDAKILVGSDDPQHIELTHFERVQITHG